MRGGGSVGGAEIHFSVYFRGEELYSACRHWEGVKESVSFYLSLEG